jgi:hypothetical protein
MERKIFNRHQGDIVIVFTQYSDNIKTPSSFARWDLKANKKQNNMTKKQALPAIMAFALYIISFAALLS